uniref:Uncharacterized protein n=1 Tax=Caulerpa lentillifera TaxID=148947 RepID=A0A2Z2QKB2_9CHLO|nr:hypothetical protein [Caulerpa lentillifera]AST24224.1 hypothetical protein [Caulerpa lentillifera]
MLNKERVPRRRAWPLISDGIIACLRGALQAASAPYGAERAGLPALPCPFRMCVFMPFWLVYEVPEKQRPSGSFWLKEVLQKPGGLNACRVRVVLFFPGLLELF